MTINGEYVGTKRALIIAISDYDKLKPLDFCKEDGEAMYSLLNSIGYEIAEHHKLIGRVEYSELHDAVIEFFADDSVRKNDTMLFYFSGHGVPSNNADEHYLSSSEINPDKPRLRGFSFDELTKTRQDCNSKTIFTILDCCYSGAATVSKGDANHEAAIGRKIIETKSKIEGEGKCILAACQPLQEAYIFEGHNNSLFTFFLLDGLAGANGESTDDGGNVTPELLHEFVFNKIIELPSNTQPKQRPLLKCESAGKIVLAQHAHLTKNHNMTTDDLKNENAMLSERLKINEKKQQEFINIVAHELKNPIQPIFGLIDALKSKVTDSQGQELLDLILRNTKRLQRTADDVLSVAKIEGQPFRLFKEQFNLKGLLLDVVEDYGFQLRGSNININLSDEFDNQGGTCRGRQK